ncbi:hypothetical protein QFC22_002735 [Naganishia vaughanmartiniae]|uniref:Uncharacterized protein n=1 Tax=Naganishia vaughanmartiniae TaxID=1424756 RepID=A0ACC2XAY9_9TREE|nr:hypothetical protein QFC22_002735 [Naganishia vaughanmartiniae]
MSVRKHQVLIFDPLPEESSSHGLLADLKALLNPYYAVHDISYSALQKDPWEDQCALLYIVSPATLQQGLGHAVKNRIHQYLKHGGNVVYIIGREGRVDSDFSDESDEQNVTVIQNAQRQLVFESNSSRFTPVKQEDSSPSSGLVSIELTTTNGGKLVLTTLSPAHLSQTREQSLAILQACNIRVSLPSQPTSKSSTTESTEDKPSVNPPAWSDLLAHLLKPSKPLPQIMLVHPEIKQESLAWDFWTTGNLAAPVQDQAHVNTKVLEDENDTFEIVNLGAHATSAKEILESARSEAQASSSTAVEFLRKKTILCAQKLDDVLSAMPLFHADAYFEELKQQGIAHGQRKSANASSWNIGDVLLYGEAVTSTQTMLDKNPKVLKSLPTPFLSLATFQLSGRGRGSNQWLSPPGCLQFSLLLDLPRSFPANKLVFIQYLAALAICDGLDSDGKLGVKIKWPNDIYGESEGIGGTIVGRGVKGKAKLGGILVNSSFVDGQWKVIVGCGINILNELPTTSLSQLHKVKVQRDQHRQGSMNVGQATQVSMETSLAKILVSFDGFWNTFLEDKGFESLLDEYLGRWLHTDQAVTLTTTTPPQPLIIKTITLDHGLLRCIPDKRSNTTHPARSNMYDSGLDDRATFSYSSPIMQNMQSLRIGSGLNPEFVDLQPDGNSFDLMSGLIKRKV